MELKSLQNEVSNLKFERSQLRGRIKDYQDAFKILEEGVVRKIELRGETRVYINCEWSVFQRLKEDLK